ncbi:condensation domain-containing protein [Sinosporangium siamense]|uniref:condensation domain-containing protein n=1 Tax=Sinosporangium siamense TaxID=1367973 RepID=UPI001951A7B5|nr:condensation domain-containing protein [Sinosporangium siamense]
MSFAQYLMWIMESTGGAGSVYHMPLLVTFDGELDERALLDACAVVVRRHSVLSTAVEERDGVLVEVAAANLPTAVAAAPADLDAFVREEVLRPFDLFRGPLIRFTLVKLSPKRHVLVVVAHHLVFDGESKDVFLRDLAAFYNGTPLPRLPSTYADHAAAERVRVAGLLSEAKAFWEPRWSEPGAVHLPGYTGSSRAVAPGESLPFAIDAARLDGAGRIGVTRFELFLAALHAVLYRYGNDRVVTAVDVSTRTPETRDQLGLFVNEFPVASAPGGITSFRDLALRLRAELRATYLFREVPVARAVPRFRPRAAVAPVSVSYRRRKALPEFSGLDVSVDYTVFNHSVRSTLHLLVVEGPDGLNAHVQYRAGTLTPEAAAQIAAGLRSVLETAADEPDAALTALPVEGAGVPAAVQPVAPAAGAVTAEGTALADDIRAIWQEVLGMKGIEDDDDLFDLGGHSLTMTQIIARMRKRLRIEVSLDAFFDNPTISGVVAEIERAGRG